MTQTTTAADWNFSEVAKLVRNHLTESFGHPFVVRRNKQEQRITIMWDVGPTLDMVSQFVWDQFPVIGFDSDWGNREYDPPAMFNERLLHPYFYSTIRNNLFNAGAKDIARLVAAGANIEELNERHRSPFAWAVMFRHQAVAIALLEAGADFSCCQPGNDLHESGVSMPALWAAIESKLLQDTKQPDEPPVMSRRRRL